MSYGKSWALWLGLAINVAHAAPQPQPSDTAAAACTRALLETAAASLEDPFTEDEMRAARRVAREIQSHLESWAFAAENMKPEKVAETYASLRAAKFDVDGPALRDLFFITQRFLVVSRGFEGRLRPLREVLQTSEGDVRRIVNLFAQTDAMAYRNEVPRAAPLFLRQAQDVRAFVAAELANAPPAWRSFFEKSLGPVLRQRLRYVRVRVSAGGDRLTILSPVGIYKFSLVSDPVQRPVIAEPLVSTTDAWGRRNDRVIHLRADLYDQDPYLSSYLRTIVRADAFLHPHAPLPALEYYPQPTVLSDWQENDVVRELLALDNEVLKNPTGPGPIELGLQLPVGTGKTAAAISYLSRVPREANEGRPRYLVVVENTHILAQTLAAFKRDLDLAPLRMAMLFGDDGFAEFGVGTQKYKVRRGQSLSPPADWDLIVTTRSTLHARWSTIQAAIGRENVKATGRRPFRVLVDEGHHVGTKQGDFTTIFDRFRTELSSRDRVLVASATLFHPAENIIRDRLKGHIVATHLAPDEKATLRRGERVLELARIQFLRAMIDGWLNPFETRSYAVQDQTETNEIVRQRLKRSQGADAKLYAFAAQLILATRGVGGGFDRGLVFEPLKERAEKGADILQEILGTDPHPTDPARRSAWFAHSDLGTDAAAQRVQWFRSIEDFRGTRFMHHYFVTVSQFLEGIDIPDVNLLVIMRNFQSVIAIMQLLGRGARIEGFKIGSRLIDVPGNVIRWLEEAGELWASLAAYRAPMIDHWQDPPPRKFPQLLDPIETAEPEELELSTKQLNLEPTLAKERSRTESWRAVSRDDITASGGSAGVLRLLLNKPGTTEPAQFQSFKDWFGHYIKQFPSGSQAAWAHEWKRINLRDELVNVRTLTRRQREQAVRAFRLLARMFNGLDDRERLGLAPIADHEALGRNAFARLTFALTTRPMSLPGPLFEGHRAPLDFIETGYSARGELREALDENLLLTNAPKALRDRIVTLSANASARDALVLAHEIVITRPALARYASWLAEMSSLAEVPGDTFATELRATFLLGQFLNVVVRDAGLEAVRPKNLHGLFDLRNDEDFVADGLDSTITVHDLASTLCLAEHRLGGPPAAAPAEPVEIAPPPKPAPVTPPPSKTSPSGEPLLLRTNTLKTIFADIFGNNGTPASSFRRYVRTLPASAQRVIGTTLDEIRLPRENRTAAWTDDEARAVYKAWRLLARATGAMTPKERLGLAAVTEDEALTRAGALRLHLICAPFDVPSDEDVAAPERLVLSPMADADRQRLIREFDARIVLPGARPNELARWIEDDMPKISPLEATFLVFKTTARPRLDHLLKRLQKGSSPSSASKSDVKPSADANAVAPFVIARVFNALVREANLETAPIDLNVVFDRTYESPGHPEYFENPTLGDVFRTLDQAERRPMGDAENLPTGLLARLEAPNELLSIIRKRVQSMPMEPTLMALFGGWTNLPRPLSLKMRDLVSKPAFKRLLGPATPANTRAFAEAYLRVQNFLNDTSPRDRLGLPQLVGHARLSLSADRRLENFWNPNVSSVDPIPSRSVEAANQSLWFTRGELKDVAVARDRLARGDLLPDLDADLRWRVVAVLSNTNDTHLWDIPLAYQVLAQSPAASVFPSDVRSRIADGFKRIEARARSVDALRADATLQLGFLLNRLGRLAPEGRVIPWNLEFAIPEPTNPMDVRRSEGVEMRPTWPGFLDALDRIERAIGN